MCHARVSSKGKFHCGISVLSPNPLPRVDTAGSFIAYPKMPFNIALQHHPAALLHSKGGISILMQSCGHRALCNEQMSSFGTISPTPIRAVRQCKNSAAAQEVGTHKKRQRQCGSLCTAPARLLHCPRRSLCIPPWGEQRYRT